ncbi:MAG: tetratricopeptide repeat protein [Deltaproteobacteria bacterium]|nr:tetratricopeptide repeat protein [Deltaproteobacteria bacterium]
MSDSIHEIPQGLKLFICTCCLPIFIAMTIAGCGGPKKQALFGFHKKEASLSKKAKQAYESGHYEKALVLYQEALKASRAVEDINLTAVNLINIAVVYRQMGEREKAARTIDEILKAPHVQYPLARLSEATMVKALLLKDAQDYTQAREMTDKALKLCRQAKSREEGRIYNLKAKIALLEKDLSGAMTFGQLGLKMNRERKDQQETANSLRLIADAKTENAKYTEARLLYEEALGIDKEMGLSKKIALDLIKLGVLFQKQGHNEEALKYFQRAYSVSVGGEDEAGIRHASELIDSLKK